MAKMLRILKNALLVTAMLILVLGAYVVIVNRNATDMTGRQKILRTFYPALVWINKLTNKNREILSHAAMVPPVSFYSLKTTAIDGSPLDMASLKGKKVLLVNTASACGYTAQYGQLQELFNKANGRLLVLGFPATDFKEQETGDNAAIAGFCKKNFGVSFLLAEKSTVIKTAGQNSIFKWLTDPAQNGWNQQPPKWNFCKYLVDEEGRLINYFGPGVEPTGAEIKSATGI